LTIVNVFDKIESNKIKKVGFTLDGQITVITGGMFSGKSEYLIEKCKKIETYGKKKVKVYKPSNDDRFSDHEVVSHIGYRFKATNLPIKLKKKDIEGVLEETKDIDVVGFDEAQFFNRNIMTLVDLLAREGKQVFVAGLNMDYRGREFGFVGGLLAMADDIVRLYSYCAVCGSEKGTHTQRLINGKPDDKGSETIMIGDTEVYEPRCRSCFIPPQ